VAGHELNSAYGKVVAIRPDQSITNLYGPTLFTFNPNVFTYDLTGRLLFSDDEGGKVWTMTNGAPTVLLNLAGALHLAADRLNRIVLGVSGTRILRLHTPEGALITNVFASVATNSPLARGPGGFWGTGIFCVNTNGDLLSLDTSGVATKFGTDFGAPWGMAFGPDGALYVSEFNSDLIWRIAPADEKSLSITPDPRLPVLAVSWPAPAGDWVLECTNALPSTAAASWPVVPPPYETNAGRIFVTFTNSPEIGNRFFRLHKP
jgi:hypothetical protein